MTRLATLPWFRLGRRSLALALLLVAGSAFAVLTRAELGLQHDGTRCDGKNTYGYTASWRSAPNASFQVNSGNQCSVGGAVCGVSNADCAVRCSVTGTCRATLRLCTIGKGAAWVKVVASDRSVYQQITAAPPGRCQ